jgi:hypothetical protein
MPDRDHWDLRGPVHTVDIDLGAQHGTVEFRPDGSLVRHWRQKPDGSEWTITHAYDDAGRLVSIQEESSSGANHLRLHEYDQAGRLMRLLFRNSDGSERTIETYSYDAEGRKTKTHAAPRLPNYGYGIEGSEAFYSAPNAARITTIYNRADRPEELFFQDATGALLSRVDFRYDESGNLIEEAQTNIDSPLLSSVREQLNAEQLQAVRGLIAGPNLHLRHRYDALGRKIETLTSLFGSLSTERAVMEYNQYGDLVAQTSEDETHSYGLDDEGQLAEGPVSRKHSETRFRYEYDVHGNWFNKVTESCHGDHPDFTLISTEHRTLTYFDPI